jgi:hypothetical protein
MNSLVLLAQSLPFPLIFRYNNFVTDQLRWQFDTYVLVQYDSGALCRDSVRLRRTLEAFGDRLHTGTWRPLAARSHKRHWDSITFVFIYDRQRTHEFRVKPPGGGL